MDPSVYERLGQFYLGRPYDLEAGEIADGVTLYDSRDLTTHAVCVGMTGSGKTGLCVTLLEEAAIDGVPALVVDPKGDLANLLLTFPDLEPSDFEPWVDPDEARRRDLSTAEFAAREAELWRSGLAAWGQDGSRIARLRAAADFAVFTPGSTAGRPLSILGSFAAPPSGVLDDPELLGDRIESTVTSLLALLDMAADPLQSREHILLSTVLGEAWRSGRDLDLESLIHRIQRPTVSRIGVMDLETFFPAEDRFELAMALNNLLAAPGFQSWLQGMPLDAGRLLWTAEGRPRVSVLSIAHLSDAERMFFVSLLLNETLGWMRGQSGTSSLRALLYIDEIFGFMPPVAEPPSKKPLLTLMKQARAFGLGVVLATQNPVDLDYKGLSNAGTWFLGRLQTERDRMRVLAGLEGVSREGGGGFDRAHVEATLAGLDKRVFVLHNVHDETPRLFHTRWAMSYLRGPMTRDQIRRLTDATPAAAPQGGSGESGASVGAPLGAATAASSPSAARPVLPPDVPQVFVRPRTDVDGSDVRYVPTLLGVARIHYRDGRRGVDHRDTVTLVAALSPDDDRVDWDDARPLPVDEDRLDREPLEGAAYGPLPSIAAEAERYADWERELRDHLYRSRALVLLRSDTLDELSRPGESERDFRIRLAEALREHRDEVVEELRKKYESKLGRAEDAVVRAEAVLETQRAQAEQARLDSAFSIGEGLLTALVGGRRRRSVGRARTAARRFSRSRKEAADVDRAEESLRTRAARLAELEAELREEVAALESRTDPAREVLRRVKVQPRQRDVDVRRLALGWVPVKRD